MPLPSYLFKTSSSGNNYLSPDDTPSGVETVSKERGGVAISDASQGLTGYIWQSKYTILTGTITLQNITSGVDYNILTGVMNVTSISFAFDSNMRPFIAYTITTGEAYYYWYDTVTETYVTTQLPAGATYPLACHDDKRAFAVTGNRSDVLLFYLYNNIVYCRVQRERYSIDHRCATLTAGSKLKNVGMTTGLLVKLQVADGSLVSSP